MPRMSGLVSFLRDVFAGRPGWMNALLAFCAFMTFVYVPWDLFVKDVARDQEVWFGILFTGAWAKGMAVPHWLVYAAGFYGFLRMCPWMWPWASLYAAQVAFGMFVWGAVHVGGLGGFATGVVALAPFAWLTALLWRARERFQGSGPSLRDRYGEWALVTGASAGLGAEFARQLAREGMACVLTARREDRLRELAAELERAHGVKTRVVTADLSLPGGADALVEAVADLPLGLLVLNAGFGYPGRFDLQDTERLRAMIQVNCTAPVVLTSRLLPGLRERGRGGIVVLGSASGRQPLPLHGVYSATKAFDLFFGEALHLELRERGIDVLVLEPGSTETEFQAAAGALPHPGERPDAVVRLGLERLGRQPSVMSGWWNWLRGNLGARLLPRRLVLHLAREVSAAQTPDAMR